MEENILREEDINNMSLKELAGLSAQLKDFEMQMDDLIAEFKEEGEV